MSRTISNRALDAIEWIGNKLPDPAILFVIGAAFVMIASSLAHRAGWTVQPMKPVAMVDASGAPMHDEAGNPILDLVPNLEVNGGEPYRAVDLLTSDGLYWALNSMVDNFMGFAPLGVVLTGMLGIGISE
ncbi:MAG: AbgT family transporter [Phycisphaerales bacterium]|nr:AbgT family transporter [Phycisphaerales bacterium]